MGNQTETETGYTHTYPLFRDLNPEEVKEFKASVYPLCSNGFDPLFMGNIHPVVRKELIRLITKSLKAQGED